MSFFDQVPPLRTKICGITNLEDAQIAIRAGADALGFNLYPGSKRFLDFAEHRPWIAGLSGQTQRIAVVVNPTAEEVAALHASGCFEAIQFHGDETPEFCAASGFAHWIRAVRIKNDASLKEALAYDTPFLLLDGWSPTEYGGTGQRVNWDVAREFTIGHQDRKIILAGGLTPSNVRDAVRIARPHGVDVAGGVEMEPRRKNEYLVNEFIRAARGA